MNKKASALLPQTMAVKMFFVHKTATNDNLWEGDKVTYETEDTPKGQNAINVSKN